MDVPDGSARDSHQGQPQHRVTAPKALTKSCDCAEGLGLRAQWSHAYHANTLRKGKVLTVTVTVAIDGIIHYHLSPIITMASQQIRDVRARLLAIQERDLLHATTEELRACATGFNIFVEALAIHEYINSSTPELVANAPFVPASFAQAQDVQGIANAPPPAQAIQSIVMDASSLPAVLPAGLAADKAPRDIAVGQLGSKIPREDMILPLLASFPTLEELQDFAHTWAIEHGYDIVVESTPRPGRIRMTCARAGKTRNTRKLEDSQRRRRHTSKKCGCPFRL
jgi:hypothetical protein